MGTLEMLPEPPAALGEPLPEEQRCEACGQTVRFLTAKSREGSPEFIRAVFPAEAWFGWEWADPAQKRLAVIVLCSRACHVEWFDGEHGPGA